MTAYLSRACLVLSSLAEISWWQEIMTSDLRFGLQNQLTKHSVQQGTH